MPRFALTRRKFLLAGGLGGALLAGGVGYWAHREGIRFGLIGAGGRGDDLARNLRYARVLPLYADLVAVCDVDSAAATRLRDANGVRGEVYQDYRKMLQRDDIQAVIIATCEHWHVPIAVAAMRAGKAVYCEKPLGLTITEGQRVVQTARETKAVFAMGTQQRSFAAFRTACELVRNGRLGPIAKVLVTLAEQGKEGGPFAAAPVPPGLDWDMWLGQAPLAPYCLERHKGWHNWWEYGGGELMNWGIHHVDIVQWALGFEQTGPRTIEGQAVLPRIAGGYNVPKCYSANLVYADGTVLEIRSTHSDRCGILFQGEKGNLFVDRGGCFGKAMEELPHNPLPSDAVRLHPSTPTGIFKFANIYHLQQFMRCIKTGERPLCDAATAHRSTSVCHLANIAIRLGRKLTWDPQREQFVNDPEADAMRARTQRSPYVL